MNIKVIKNKVIIDKVPINEKEINITECVFDFEYEIGGTKKALFTLNDNTYMQYIINNKCQIPYEVLTNKGSLEIGIVEEIIENEIVTKRHNPSPDYIDTWTGTLKEYDNSEEVTPTDKEQMEQMLSNIQLGVTKEGKIVTITFTNKDGSTQTETLEDGKSIEYNWDGTSLGIRQEGQSEYTYVNLQGPQGQPGAINLLIVSQLPETGVAGTLYFVEKQDSEEKDVYDEYMWVNNDWERVGEKQIVIDLTDYVKNTDYANYSTGGVIKTGNGVSISGSGNVYGATYDYDTYQTKDNGLFIGKGTLENVITGKGLVSNTDYGNANTGGVAKFGWYNTDLDGTGHLYATSRTYAQYQSDGNSTFISKGTLDNVLTARIGDIQTLLDNLDTGSGV